MLIVALGVMTALWISTSNQLSAIEAAQAAVEADRAATPDLLDVAQRHSERQPSSPAILVRSA